MCHHNTFLVYQSMRDASLERWEKVTHISLGFAWVVAALFGIVGYATFRALSQGEKEWNVFGHLVISFPLLTIFSFRQAICWKTIAGMTTWWILHVLSSPSPSCSPTPLSALCPGRWVIFSETDKLLEFNNLSPLPPDCQNTAAQVPNPWANRLRAGKGSHHANRRPRQAFLHDYTCDHLYCIHRLANDWMSGTSFGIECE